MRNGSSHGHRQYDAVPSDSRMAGWRVKGLTLVAILGGVGNRLFGVVSQFSAEDHGTDLLRILGEVDPDLDGARRAGWAGYSQSRDASTSLLHAHSARSDPSALPAAPLEVDQLSYREPLQAGVASLEGKRS